MAGEKHTVARDFTQLNNDIEGFVKKVIEFYQPTTLSERLQARENVRRFLNKAFWSFFLEQDIDYNYCQNANYMAYDLQQQIEAYLQKLTIDMREPCKQALFAALNKIYNPLYFASVASIQRRLNADPGFASRQVIWYSEFPLCGFIDQNNLDSIPYLDLIDNETDVQLPINIAFNLKQSRLIQIFLEQENIEVVELDCNAEESVSLIETHNILAAAILTSQTKIFDKIITSLPQQTCLDLLNAPTCYPGIAASRELLIDTLFKRVELFDYWKNILNIDFIQEYYFNNLDLKYALLKKSLARAELVDCLLNGELRLEFPDTEHKHFLDLVSHVIATRTSLFDIFKAHALAGADEAEPLAPKYMDFLKYSFRKAVIFNRLGLVRELLTYTNIFVDVINQPISPNHTSSLIDLVIKLTPSYTQNQNNEVLVHLPFHEQSQNHTNIKQVAFHIVLELLNYLPKDQIQASSKDEFKALINTTIAAGNFAVPTIVLNPWLIPLAITILAKVDSNHFSTQIQRLVMQTKINCNDLCGYNALDYVLIAGSVDLSKFLIKHGAMTEHQHELSTNPDIIALIDYANKMAGMTVSPQPQKIRSAQQLAYSTKNTDLFKSTLQQTLHRLHIFCNYQIAGEAENNRYLLLLITLYHVRRNALLRTGANAQIDKEYRNSLFDGIMSFRVEENPSTYIFKSINEKTQFLQEQFPDILHEKLSGFDTEEPNDSYRCRV